MQCDWQVRSEHGPLLSVDGQLRGILQLPLLCAIFGLHEHWVHLRGARHVNEVSGFAPKRPVRCDGLTAFMNILK